MRMRAVLVLACGLGLSVVGVWAKGDGEAAPSKPKPPPLENVSGMLSEVGDASLTVARKNKEGVVETAAIKLGADTMVAEVGRGALADIVKDAAVVVFRRGEGADAVAAGVAVYAGAAKDGLHLAKIATVVLGDMPREGKPKGEGEGKPAYARPVLGKVKSVDGGSLAVTTYDGDVTVKLGADTPVAVARDKARADLVKGRPVMIYAAADESGAKTARLVVQMPERKKDVDKPREGKPDGDKPKGDKPREGKPEKGDKPREGKPDGDKPKDKPREG
jgi:hypothetical protein